jgi:hypothetical protein
VRVAIIGIVVAFGWSCAPDLTANSAQRCDEDVACGAQGVCYRGFCLSDPNDPVVIEAREAGVTESGATQRPQSVASDAGTDASSVNVSVTPSATGAGTTPSATTTSQTGGASAATPVQEPPAAPGSADAGSNGNTGGGSNGATGPAPKPPAKTPTPAPAAGAPDAGATGPVDAGTATPMSPPVDAATPADAAPAIPGNCTLEECCAEALGQTPAGDDDDDDKGTKGAAKATKCGCNDPALLRTLTCGVLAPLGAIL